jgi:hypothetical protein
MVRVGVRVRVMVRVRVRIGAVLDLGLRLGIFVGGVRVRVGLKDRALTRTGLLG